MAKQIARTVLRRGQAFGIEVWGDYAISSLTPASNSHTVGRTVLTTAAPQVIDRACPRRDADWGGDVTGADGQRLMSIDHHPVHGYRIWAPRYGRHLISKDGREVQSALPRVADWRWQRLLFAQVLPLTAILHGLEVIHASAVAMDGRVVAFVAASGTGKTSVAQHLVAGGASFVTDDVLALEASGERVLAHPGPGFATIDPRQLESISPDQRGRLGSVVGRGEKIVLHATTITRALPLRSLYLLERGPHLREMGLEREASPDPRELLAARFLGYLRTRARLENLLEVTAAIATHCAVFRLRVPPGVPASEVAAMVAAREAAGAGA